MATHERRRKLTIEEVNVYWRALKEGTEAPNLQRLCNAIRTLDLALGETDSALHSRLSSTAWSRERDDCFDFLLSSFAGYFVVYAEGSNTPLEAEADWPEEGGRLEFYPEMVRRRDDAFASDLGQIHSALILRLRWCFADGRQQTTPDDFTSFRECCRHYDNPEQAQEARLLLEKLYEACADEASKLKKIAHRKWWQLQSEVISCGDRRQKHRLRKQMEQLELIWGPSSSQHVSN